MPAFHVDHTYYIAARDIFLLAGHTVSGTVKPGMAVDLPKEIRGPGWVPIGGVQTVPFGKGVSKLCLLIDYQFVAAAPFMEFDHLHGKTLDVRGGYE